MAASATLSVVTGYAGSLLSTAWQRRQDRRTYGLALLAEVRAVRRGLADYGRRLDLMLADDRLSEEERRHLADVLPYWRHDTGVFGLGAARIGLFSPPLAVALVEFYSRVRWLDTRAAHAPNGTGIAGAARLVEWLNEHRRSIAMARRHAGTLLRGLKRETPGTVTELLGAVRGRRHRLARARRALRRV